MPAARKTRPQPARPPIEGAVASELPPSLAPQLATLAARIPPGAYWGYSIKLDGYRMMARVENGRARLFTRGGHDWSAKMPALIAELDAMNIGSAWLDGEVVSLNAQGTPDFNALQNSFDRGAKSANLVYFVFELPFLNGWDFRASRHEDRYMALAALFETNEQEHVRLCSNLPGDPYSILASACGLGLEGLIAKRLDSPYVSARTDTWLKLKCKLRQEFIIAGFIPRTDAASQVGKLLLGVYGPDGTFKSAGGVGTGWSANEAVKLRARLNKLVTSKVPFVGGVPKPDRWSKNSSNEKVIWVSPELVAEVEFAEWTPGGQIRHASYRGLRDDKPAREVVREPLKGAANSPNAAGSASKAATVRGGPVSHPGRIIDPVTGLTKRDLVLHYERVSRWMLPHLVDRPCSFLRGPEGVTGELFFQKHADTAAVRGLTLLESSLWPGHAPLMVVNSEAALWSAGRANVIELHTWNSRSGHIDRPDQMVFDLDPGEGTSWEHVQEDASLVRLMLQELGLKSWLKTSGGKGLHLLVPLAPVHEVAVVKGFSQAIVEHLARAIPSRFVSKSGPSNRVGRLFVDYLRNNRAATTAAAFSARARPGLGVSMTVDWDDLPLLTSGAHWTVANAANELSTRTKDPWRDYWSTPQLLSAPMERLGFKPPTAR
ncbi:MULTISPECIES: DNA ligase D [unclassified Variovorax]|uniref:DNA ligase D n=1 Tax=unclassified Variovorax TaxID=663243 RepID=UPI00076C196D|nr:MULTISPECIES: DNA ligase D [unclassified Variovorax]KWT98417.1 ATP-dependent DNA ligase clustered with Ku protein, LigD [Variovorax sp. WDL1]VTV18004.1 Multifunctional non-homologous end joining protein LigD [Variovorax sp. WDL1]